MMQKDRNEIVKQLREKTGAGMMDCKKALEACNFNIDKAVKYLRYMPNNLPMDYWSNKQYLFCEHCDRFYIVKRGVKKCNVCGNDLCED